MDLAMLLIRLYLGLNFIAYGSQKLFGVMGGPGLDGFTGYSRSLGLRPARPKAVLGAVTEFVSGILILLGLLTPLASAGIMGDMIVAIVLVHLPNGWFNAKGGMTYNVSLIVAALALVLAGPGAYSLDAVLGLELAGIGWALASLVAGVIAAAVVLAGRERTPTGAEA